MSVTCRIVRTVRSGSITDTQKSSGSSHIRGHWMLSGSLVLKVSSEYMKICCFHRYIGTSSCSEQPETLLIYVRNVSTSSFWWIFRPVLQQKPLFRRKKSRVPICRAPGTMPEPGENRLFRRFISAYRRSTYQVAVLQLTVTAAGSW